MTAAAINTYFSNKGPSGPVLVDDRAMSEFSRVGMESKKKGKNVTLLDDYTASKEDKGIYSAFEANIRLYEKEVIDNSFESIMKGSFYLGIVLPIVKEKCLHAFGNNTEGFLKFFRFLEAGLSHGDFVQCYEMRSDVKSSGICSCCQQTATDLVTLKFDTQTLLSSTNGRKKYDRLRVSYLKIDLTCYNRIRNILAIYNHLWFVSRPLPFYGNQGYACFSIKYKNYDKESATCILICFRDLLKLLTYNPDEDATNQ
jgi:hypothetical protein